VLRVPDGSGSCHNMSMSKLMGLVHSEIVDFLNTNSFRPLKSCGGRMDGSQAYTLRKRGRTLIWGSYKS